MASCTFWLLSINFDCNSILKSENDVIVCAIQTEKPDSNGTYLMHE